ncbi:hypothetical protein [Methylococcus sp. EFPC2]|uniref:hypothetical protein n=1 Tax=Methylococcus sp. EFPC2 TaxID=2812648 RepID=UPI001966D91D|nr:hypothetical protein [Methylococcus sp. EFPC2]QSA97714.1 hypothetical protein JWZ97_02435 [Methylococcus sp. EFPC2]
MKSAIPLLLCTSLLAGCAGNQYGFPVQQFGTSGPNVGELIDFQRDFAARSATARAEECRWLSQRQKETPQASWLLRLMMGRALSDNCGDTSRLLSAYEDLARQNTLDAPVAGMAAYQAEILKRLGSGSSGRRAAASERRATKGEAEPKASKDETKLLREKLEAIRSLEKKMDEDSAAPAER